MMERVALEAIGVSKRFGNRDALRGVDLIVEPGRLHGLLGPNGAGKTTLLRILLGLVRRDAGTVRLLGNDLHAPGGPVPGGVAGFVEMPAFYPYLSGRINLELLARLDDDGRSRRAGRVGHVLEQVGLAADADVRVASYSTGMRQRLGLAAALLRSPQLLFLDEPTSSLDPGGARDVRALARRLADEGVGVLFSSHDLAEVQELCSRLTVINRGRVVFSGTADEMRKRASATIHALRTSDDRRALDLALAQPGVRAVHALDGGLEVSADTEALDAYVIALGRAGVAVRVLERRARSLESLFFELTGRDDAGQPPGPPSGDAADGRQASVVVS